MRTWWDLKWKKNVCNQFCASFSSYPSYLRCSTHNSTIMWCFLKESHCKSSIRNSQDAIFMQIALCAKLRNLRTTENIGNVGRMHLKCKKFPGSCQQLFKEPIARTFQRLLFVIAGEKKQQLPKWKDCVELLRRGATRSSDNGAEDVLQLAFLPSTRIKTATMPKSFF